MGSPFRVEPVSVLDRNEDSSSIFLVFGWSLCDGITLSGRVCLRSRSERRLFAHPPLRSRRDRLQSLDRYQSRLGRSRSRGDRSRSTGSALSVTGRVLWTAPGHVVSVRIPQLVEEVGVTVRGHMIPPVALVTARDHVVDNLPPLTPCGLRRKDEREGIRGLLPFICPSLLRDGVTLRVVCVFSHSYRIEVFFV